MTATTAVKVKGLRELQAALKATEDGAQKELRVALNRAAELVARGAARRVPTKTGRARASLRAQSSQREARVVGGSKKVPYYGWLEFGGRIGKDRSVRRPFVQGGRYLWPSYAAQRAQVAQVIAGELDALMKRTGLDG
jgi:multidrug efflux pump subunit AcrA (membrane-fusion protein)